MAKKDQVNAAYTMLTGGGSKTAAGKNTPVGVVLTPGQKARLSEIAAELGTNRHKVLQYAIADFIRRYEAGEKPKTRVITKTELDTKGE